MTTIYFATNRRPNRQIGPDDFGGDFAKVTRDGGEGVADLRFGKATVSAKGAVSLEVRRDPPVGRQRLGSYCVFEELRTRMADNSRDVLIGVHGFNVSFQEAVRWAARLSKTYAAANVEVVLFTWPSQGELLKYQNDRLHAQISGAAMARAIKKFIGFLRSLRSVEDGVRCEREVHLLAHSMGCYVLRNALQEMTSWTPRSLPRIFGDIILAAADEDEDAFAVVEKLARLPETAKRVHVYFNRGDRALQVSDVTKGHPDRLGAAGPAAPRTLHAKISLVDCSRVVRGVTEHDYAWSDATVAADIAAMLRGSAVDSSELNREYAPHWNHFRLHRPPRRRTTRRRRPRAVSP
ncbi:MAG: alpha/beta fold hydrolase [Planctomycetota bacterium]